jgi:hypothetical protein
MHSLPRRSDASRRALARVAISALLLAPPCASAGAQGTAPAKDALEVQVEAELQRDISDARAMDGEAPALRIQRVDLNGDGQFDAIVLVEHPLTCGSGGCAVHVFVSEAGGLRRVGDFLAHQASVATTSTAGWRDLVVQGRSWTYVGGRYRPASQRPPDARRTD